jgi:hypothetical protein
MVRALLLVVLVGCSEKTEPTAAEPACPTGLVREGTACAPRFDTCPENEIPAFGGGCTAIGAKVLAAPSCSDGLTAVPGEASCHPIADCGTGTWGTIPDDSNARYVDEKAADGGDGSRAMPFKTVAEALARAPSGAMIAIAAGSYTVNIDVSTPLRIRGRCPSMVELKGDPALLSDHVIQATANVEIKGVSITSPYIGVGVYRGDVTIDSVYFHDTEFSAIEALGYSAPPKVVVRNVVIERPRQVAMNVFGASAIVDRTVIRNGRSRTDGKTGDGIVVRPRKEGDVLNPAQLQVMSSVIEKMKRSSITAFGAKLEVEGTIVRGTRADDTGSGGPGIVSEKYETKSADLSLRASLLEDNEFSQLSVQSGVALVEMVVARKGVPTKAGLVGGGMVFEVGTSFTLKDALVEQTRAFGVAVSGASGTIERLIVRDVAQDAKGIGGLGIQIGDDEETHAPSTVTLKDSRFDRCAQLGVLIMGSTVDAEGLAIFDVKPDSEQIFGDGIGISAHRVRDVAEPVLASLKLKKSLVERANRAALTIYGADVTIESSRFRCSPIAINAERAYGPPESGNTFERNFVLEDLGGNVCGCGAATVCRVENNGIVPLR